MSRSVYSFVSLMRDGIAGDFDKLEVRDGLIEPVVRAFTCAVALRAFVAVLAAGCCCGRTVCADLSVRRHEAVGHSPAHALALVERTFGVHAAHGAAGYC